MNLNSALSSFAHSGLARDLKAAIPTVLALSAAGVNPVASTAVSAALSSGTTASFSDLGKQLAGLGSSVVNGVESVVSGVESGLGSVVSGAESVVAPVVYGLGALINAVA